MNLSYQNDSKLKKMFVAEIVKHREADQIIQGTYGEDNVKFKGCAVGCSIHSLNIKLGKNYDTNDHAALAREILGGEQNEWLAQLEDTIFEGLSVEKSKLWPEQFAKAIPVGARLEPVKFAFCAYLMRENIERVLSLDIDAKLKKQVVDAIGQVLAVHEDAIRTGIWDKLAAESAGSAAESAESAARSTASEVSAVIAWSAGWSAAWSAASAAESVGSAENVGNAVWSAVYGIVESAEGVESARNITYTRYSTELLRLITNSTKQDQGFPLLV